MKAARFYDRGDIRIEDIPEPKVLPGTVGIQVAWCGICGTDLHEFMEGPIFIPPCGHPHPISGESAPVTMGHEFSGGGVALVRAVNALDGLKGINEDQTAGINILRRAIEAPLRQIVANAGDEPSVVINAVKAGEGNFGYNAATGEYGDMLEMGILDPAKVTRSALEHAASVAGLMSTTEAMITDIPEDKPAAPDMGGMGGMGGMM